MTGEINNQYVEYATRIVQGGFYIEKGKICAPETHVRIASIVMYEPNPEIKITYPWKELGYLQFAISLRDFLRSESIPFAENMSASRAAKKFLKNSGLQAVLDEN